MLDFYVKTGIRFSLRDKRLFEITEVEITRVDCIPVCIQCHVHVYDSAKKIHLSQQLYFLSLYDKVEWESFQNSHKNLDPSYEMDLDFWECFRKETPISQLNFIRLIRYLGSF